MAASQDKAGLPFEGRGGLARKGGCAPMGRELRRGERLAQEETVDAASLFRALGKEHISGG